MTQLWSLQRRAEVATSRHSGDKATLTKPDKPLTLLVNAAVGEALPDDAGVDSSNTLAAITGEDADEPVRDSLVLQSLEADDLAIRQGP